MAKALKKTSLGLRTITIIRKAITPEIAQSQKTSCNLGNIHNSDY